MNYKRIGNYLLPAVVWFSTAPIVRAATEDVNPHPDPVAGSGVFNSGFFINFFQVYKSESGLTTGGFIGQFLNFLLTIASAVALVYLIYNGIQLVTSAGDEAKMEQAKKGLMWTIIGIVAIFLVMVLIYATQNAVQGK